MQVYAAAAGNKMPRSVIGSGVALDHTTNYATLIDIHRAVGSTTMLGMVDNGKDAGKIRQLQRDLPQSKIIARVWHEHEGGYAQPPTGAGDTRAMIATPSAILSDQGHLGQDGMWLHVMNEPSLYMKPFEVQRTIDWLIDFIEEAAPRGVDCVVGNFADEHPAVIGGLWDPITWPLLRVMGEHTDRIRLGLHFYGPDKIANVITALNETCKELGVKAPHVVGTEFGLDSTGQGDSKNGYHTRMSGAQFMVWSYEQVHGVLLPFFQSGQLIGVDTFQWNPLWGQFNIAKDAVYQETFKDMGSRGELDVVIIPTKPPTYKPGVRPEGLKGGFYYKVGLPTSSRLRNIRALPDDTSADVGDVVGGDIVCLYDIPLERNMLKNQRWQYCISIVNGKEGAEGWMWTDGIKLTPVAKPVPPAVVYPEPVEPVPEPAPEKPVEPEIPTPPSPPPVTLQMAYVMSREERLTLIKAFTAALETLLAMQETDVTPRVTA